MAESEHPAQDRQPGRAARVDRHRIAMERAAAAAAEAAALAEPPPAPSAPAPPAKAAPVRPVRTFRPASGPAPAKDKTDRAVRRPALLSDRCVGCGAATKGRSGMVTELVEVGPVRALRVIACSACPDRRRRGLATSS
jgi:hypothetical protein